MEDQVERLVDAVLLAHRVLDLLEDARREHHVARLVDTVHVAEGCGDHVAPALTKAELCCGGQSVLRVEKSFASWLASMPSSSPPTTPISSSMMMFAW